MSPGCSPASHELNICGQVLRLRPASTPPDCSISVQAGLNIPGLHTLALYNLPSPRWKPHHLFMLMDFPCIRRDPSFPTVSSPDRSHGTTGPLTPVGVKQSGTSRRSSSGFGVCVVGGKLQKSPEETSQVRPEVAEVRPPYVTPPSGLVANRSMDQRQRERAHPSLMLK